MKLWKRFHMIKTKHRRLQLQQSIFYQWRCHFQDRQINYFHQKQAF
jgi:hypothetical protein